MPTKRRWIYSLPKYCLLIDVCRLNTAASLQIPNQQSSTTENNLHPTGRRWKRRRKQQTFLPSPHRDVTPFEEEALTEQLGYLPPNICSISARSGDCTRGTSTAREGKIDTSKHGVGRPVAIKSYPLLIQQLQTDGTNKNEHTGNSLYENCNITPFPTMYWLSDTHISRAISELERSGHVYEFQTRLEDNVLLAKEWLECHAEYADERWMLLSDQDREWLLMDNSEDEKQMRTVESMRGMVRYSGVAGMDYRGEKRKDSTWDDAEPFVPYVKCLHSHYAHYRSQLSLDASRTNGCRLNVVGLWTHELLQEKFTELVL
eukprot:scaffold94953_cov58-Cyclotella_meneghiniana.AAC.6